MRARKLLVTPLVAAALFAGCRPGVMAMDQVKQHTVFEARAFAEGDYANPLFDISVRAVFLSPNGEEVSVPAFWDGESVWCVRFAPHELGPWRWHFESEPADAGLKEAMGEFECVAYDGDNPVLRGGHLRLSGNHRYLVDSTGKPFFWMGDTAWNGVMRATEEDWAEYLRARRDQGFTVIQFVCTHWRGLTHDPKGEQAYTGTNPLRINPAFFQRLDRKVAMINEYGLVGAGVLLWAVMPNDPGNELSEKDAIALARYIVARWEAHAMVWFLGGDSNYTGDRAERWRHIGRGVFEGLQDQVVTLHPCGRSWPLGDFKDERWYDFVGYQSSHGAGEDTLKWLAEGPPAQDWRKDPPRPFINLEPNYEAHPAYGHKHTFNDFDVRRALYWSLLNAPTAGVSYGHNYIWTWNYKPAVPEGHPDIGVVPTWREGLHAPAAEQVRYLRKFFDGIEWWRLVPAPDLLAAQPGEQDVRHFVMASASKERDLVVVYTPGGPVKLKADALKRPAQAQWYDPRTGKTAPAADLAEGTVELTPPGEGDWLLLITSK
ncbi:MAG: DUF4038 domain-containing protein [Armatimonadetes bacterium]|nr:DUF4038 domain-containing protein [Armatimonadota bacterium]